MNRIALRITPEIIEMASELTGTDTIFPDNLFLVVEMIGVVEFNAKLMTEDEVVEEFKKDPTLQVV